jgi:glycosyltransferase involved in cell wall biosynthesis
MRNVLVTTCLNESDGIRGWVEDVERQTRLPDEVVVVDGGSVDGTVDVLSSWKPDRFRVRFSVEPGCTVAQGRNAAIRMSDATIIASTDMGCRLTATWFEGIVRPFEEDSACDVVAGNYTVAPTALSSLSAHVDYYLSGKYTRTLTSDAVPSSRTIAYRRKVWEELGGYPEDLRYAGDDMVFGLQMKAKGYKTVPAPNAMVFWVRHKQWRKFMREAFLYGRGSGEAGLRHDWCDWYQREGFERLRAWLFGARGLFRRSAVVGSLHALRNGCVVVGALVPIFSAQRAYCFLRGYQDGRLYGNEHCASCRARLRR